MNRYFLVVESTVPESDPRRMGGTEIFDSFDSILEYLEPWFADESHVILDMDGNRYRYISDGLGSRIETVQNGDDDRAVFQEKLLDFVKTLPREAREKLGMPNHAITMRDLSMLLQDKQVMSRLCQR